MTTFIIAMANTHLLQQTAQLVGKLYPNARVRTATTGYTAYEMLLSSTSSPLLILSSDLQDLPPLDLIKKIQQDTLIQPLILLLTRPEESELRFQALEHGVDDILLLPYSPEYFYLRISRLRRFHRLSTEYRRLEAQYHHVAEQLENLFQQTIEVLERAQNTVIPEASEISPKIAEIAHWIAEHFGEFTKEQIAAIEAAGRISSLGRIFLPDDLLHQPPTINGIATHQLMHQIPYCSDRILEPLPLLQPIRAILHSLFENYDGTGFPDRTERAFIPLESRVLRIAFDFQMYLYAFSISPLEALNKMQQDAKKVYDPRLLSLLDEYIWTNLREDLQEHIQVIDLQDLQEGMILARDLVTNAGMKLASSGTQLTTKIIEHILNHATHDPIIGAIYIRIRE